MAVRIETPKFPGETSGDRTFGMSREQALEMAEMAEMARKQAAITTGKTRQALLEIARKYEAMASSAPPAQA